MNIRGRPPKWTDAQILDKLCQFYEATGRWPQQPDLGPAHDMPSQPLLTQRFGGTKAAMRQASAYRRRQHPSGVFQGNGREALRLNRMAADAIERVKLHWLTTDRTVRSA